MVIRLVFRLRSDATPGIPRSLPRRPGVRLKVGGSIGWENASNTLQAIDSACCPDLTGAEFKISSYLYRQLETQEVVETTITTLSRATGVSWRQTQACLQSLAEQGVLRVHCRKGYGTECRLPAAPPTELTLSPSQHLPADNVENVSAEAAKAPDGEVEARQFASLESRMAVFQKPSAEIL